MVKPFEEDANDALIEMVLDRRQEGWTIELLKEPPISTPGCDDPDGRFNWYEIRNEKEEYQGIFFTTKDVVL